MTHTPHILVVDDDARLRTLLRKYLKQEGFTVSTAENISKAREALSFFVIDALVVDVMMPGGRGTELLSASQETLPPILFLSAMGEANDRIHALSLGGQDYMVKPFEPKELVLRLRNMLRHKKHTLSLGALDYDLVKKSLFHNGAPVTLTAIEGALLHQLALSPHQVVPREHILEHVFPSASHPRVVDVNINRLRKKLEEYGDASCVLVSVRGQGYSLKST